jgi:hypothetical protein
MPEADGNGQRSRRPPTPPEQARPIPALVSGTSRTPWGSLEQAGVAISSVAASGEIRVNDCLILRQMALPQYQSLPHVFDFGGL